MVTNDIEGQCMEAGERRTGTVTASRGHPADRRIAAGTPARAAAHAGRVVSRPMR